MKQHYISTKIPSLLGFYYLGHVRKRLNFGWLVGASVLSLLLSACASSQEQVEMPYSDMYEVKNIQVETITNEITTTIFIAKFVETNRLSRAVSGSITDFGGYEFEDIKLDEKGFVDGETPAGQTQIEFQCVDGSCGIKEK